MKTLRRKEESKSFEKIRLKIEQIQKKNFKTELRSV
jgi:hypothetical protein